MSFRDFPLSAGDCRFLEARAAAHTLPQTLLLTGGDAQMRQALVREIAMAVVCRDRQNAPCGHCSACKKCVSGNHPDLAFYAPDAKSHTYKVDTCREIRRDAFVVPNDGDSKVYILEDSQAMQDSSENALLKILEEPPAGVYFLLTCDNQAAMLPTVLSRAVVLSMPAVVSFSASAQTAACALADAMATQNEWQMLLCTAALPAEREALREILECLCAILTEALCRKKGGAGEGTCTETAASIAERLSKQKLYAALQAAQALWTDAAHNANINLLTTGICYRLKAATEQK